MLQTHPQDQGLSYGTSLDQLQEALRINWILMRAINKIQNLPGGSDHDHVKRSDITSIVSETLKEITSPLQS